jgi:hypothetical protein
VVGGVGGVKRFGECLHVCVCVLGGGVPLHNNSCAVAMHCFAWQLLSMLCCQDVSLTCKAT